MLLAVKPSLFWLFNLPYLVRNIQGLELWPLPRPISCQPMWMPLSVKLWISMLQGCLHLNVQQLMRLLLDTQVMLWWLLNDPRLGPETPELMAASPFVIRASLLVRCSCQCWMDM